MAFCEQCGAELMADARFCQECGKPVPEPSVRLCAGCGQLLPDGGAFCPSCGFPVNAAATVEAQQVDDVLVITVADVAEGLAPDAAEPEEPAAESSGDEVAMLNFQMDAAELNGIADMLAESVQTDQQRLLDLVRQMTRGVE